MTSSPESLGDRYTGKSPPTSLLMIDFHQGIEKSKSKRTCYSLSSIETIYNPFWPLTIVAVLALKPFPANNIKVIIANNNNYSCTIFIVYSPFSNTIKILII